ncbi:F-box and associated interaction domains-containing protein putative isoform 1 [Tripterygium wilfordii]|uniref:F-box and associated interaction domains-containing protein putative isoform 1 n=1 Tax=Tripterygium wilfordii TaxID=458696 RepID=A0A7J7C7S8_TRIWF|nr:F-box/kelch-repeat protein At3g23880-like [Tripterygium wilfordii]KAF5730188.1 F-box and associated interaction domains-containing protein putative isoform 1 [Tripterygium wilfordii]
MATVKNTDIPEDEVIDILTRLPVKSLMRFKSVCKPWGDLLRNPDFIRQHHLKQTHLSCSSNFRVLMKHGAQPADCFFSLSLSSARDAGEEVLTLEERVYDPVVLGPCNGLLCVYGYREKIVLWNPAIREFKTLPLSPIKRRSGTGSFGSLGFGFDCEANDYKILRFVTDYFADDGAGVPSCDQIEIYSQKNDSWREIPSLDVCPGGVPWFSQYHNGVYYWWADGINGGLILSFDFADEVFDKVPLPGVGVSWGDCLPQLAIFNGLLALIRYIRGGPETLVHIWVMSERGVKGSWVKQASIGLIPGVVRPLKFSRNGGFFLEDLEGQLSLYDPSSQQLKNLQLSGGEGLLQVINYVESLVPINDRREDEDEPSAHIRI